MEPSGSRRILWIGTQLHLTAGKRAENPFTRRDFKVRAGVRGDSTDAGERSSLDARTAGLNIAPLTTIRSGNGGRSGLIRCRGDYGKRAPRLRRHVSRRIEKYRPAEPSQPARDIDGLHALQSRHLPHSASNALHAAKMALLPPLSTQKSGLDGKRPTKFELSCFWKRRLVADLSAVALRRRRSRINFKFQMGWYRQCYWLARGLMSLCVSLH